MANFITLTEYKEAEGISSPKEDLRLNHIIPSVSQLVKTYCGNSIIDYFVTPKVEEFSIDWSTNIIQLTESPVNTVSTVQIRSNFDDAYETLDSTEYYVNTNTDSIHRVRLNWPQGLASVKITYTAGYSECPADLKLAVMDLITYYLKDEHKERKTIAGASIQNQSSSSQRDNVAFPDHIKRVLDLYKNF